MQLVPVSVSQQRAPLRLFVTSIIRSRNWARGVLLSECLFVLVGGLAITLAPEQACERMAALRGIPEVAVQCPSYTGAEPVFEMYTFSLGKHQALIALVFSYFAFFGRSKAAINIGLIYFAVAGSLDAIPVLTWFADSELVISPFPGIFVLAFVFTLGALFAVPANTRHHEWAAV